MQNLIIGSGRRRTSLIKLFSFPFPRFPLFILAFSPPGWGRSWNQLVAVGLSLWNFIFFPPPKSCPVCHPAVPMNSLVLLEYFHFIFCKTWNAGVNIPHNHQTKITQQSFFSLLSYRNSFHAIFNNTRGLDSWEYTNYWSFLANQMSS